MNFLIYSTNNSLTVQVFRNAHVWNLFACKILCVESWVVQWMHGDGRLIILQRGIGSVSLFEYSWPLIGQELIKTECLITPIMLHKLIVATGLIVETDCTCLEIRYKACTIVSLFTSHVNHVYTYYLFTPVSMLVLIKKKRNEFCCS